VRSKPYSADIQPLMQTLLAILADLDFAHECELERIVAGPGNLTLKECLRARLEAQHGERRAPYLQQLDRLEARMRAEAPDVRGPLAKDAA
jgi:hypothetical protein